MDELSEQTLARIIRETRVAALGTLHEGEPNLAIVTYSFAEDFPPFTFTSADWANTPHPMSQIELRNMVLIGWVLSNSWLSSMESTGRTVDESAMDDYITNHIWSK